MKKIALTFSAMMLAGSLAACNMYDDRANEPENTNMRPIGYYSNDDGNTNRKSPFQDADDLANNRNEGPLVDMIDNDDQKQVGYNPQNVNRRGPIENRGDFGYYNGTDRDLARKISNRVKDINGVADVRTIVYGDQIIVGVYAQDMPKNIDRKVKAAVRDIVPTQNVTVVTDDKMFDRIRNVDDHLQNGNGINEVQADINGILKDLGNAISRPFQNNAR